MRGKAYKKIEDEISQVPIGRTLQIKPAKEGILNKEKIPKNIF